jgi:hypothetical protein
MVRQNEDQITPLTVSRVRIVGAIAITALVAHALGIFGDGAPSLRSPYPMPLALLALLGVPPIVLAGCVGALFYVSTRRAAVSGDSRPTGKVRVLLMVAILASAANFISGWDFGIRYQGKAFVVTSICISIIAVAILSLVLSANVRDPRRRFTVSYYFVLFAWLGRYALRYVGSRDSVRLVRSGAAVRGRPPLSRICLAARYLPLMNGALGSGIAPCASRHKSPSTRSRQGEPTDPRLRRRRKLTFKEILLLRCHQSSLSWSIALLRGRLAIFL